MPSQEEYLDSLLKDLTGNINDLEPDAEEVKLDDFASEAVSAENMITQDIILDSIAELEDIPLVDIINSQDGDSTDVADLTDIVDSEEIHLEDILQSDDTDIEEYEQEGILDTDILGVEDTASMTEEDIERLLAANQSMAETEQNISPKDDDLDAIDLMQMLDNIEDIEVQDIQEMLQKSDNNEAIDDNLIAMLQGADEQENFVPDFESEEVLEELLDNKEKKAAEKKRKKLEEREAKREAKKLAREAKRLEKEAAKEAAREARALKAAEKKAAKEMEAVVPEMLPEDVENIEEVDLGDINEFADLEEAIDVFTTLDDEPRLVEPEELDQDLLDALNASDDMLLDVSASDSVFDRLSHEEIADSEIEKIAGANKPKKGFWSKIVDLLTEEDDETEETNQILLSEENKSILNDMDKEGGKKAKKGKKEKKEKKPKEEKTPKKEKKPKKEKPPKVKEVEAPGKKLSKKKVLVVMLFGLSIGAAIILMVNVVGDYAAKKAAKTAYQKQDYQTCYQNLHGKELDETEQQMYYRSESILRIKIWLRQYEIFVGEGSELEALDVLIRSVDDYPDLYEFASQWNAKEDVEPLYVRILQILSDKYHLTEEQAREIANTPGDVAYTKKVMAIVAGEGYGSWDKKEQVTNEEQEEPSIEQLPDSLPEEEELANTEFIDNNIQE